jgi:hypothetical protein
MCIFANPQVFKYNFRSHTEYKLLNIWSHFFKKQIVCGHGIIWTSSCEHGNELSGSVKVDECTVSISRKTLLHGIS